MNLRVGIVGATGYTALEAARWLARHPRADLVAATSRGESGARLADVHPSLRGMGGDVTIETLDAADLATRCDVVMSCLPHGASAETVRELSRHGTRVIDFSADFRLGKLETYQQWYAAEHPWPERIGHVAYGLPEFFAGEIRTADVVANPGCYPTSAILPLAPLIAAELIESGGIIVDSKSGVSGAGRGLKLGTLYCETNESIAAYAVGGHRHQPEIDDLVTRISGVATEVLFTPHLTPMERGILSTIYVTPKGGATASDVTACWQGRFAGSPFVTPVDAIPATKDVRGTNFVRLAARDAGDRIVLLSVIDNLVKGASGAAVQNMNVMFGLDETCGLH